MKRGMPPIPKPEVSHTLFLMTQFNFELLIGRHVMTRGLLWLPTSLNDIKTFHVKLTCVETPYTLIFQDLDCHTETLYLIQTAI